jgi:hypothetical protein
MRQTLYPAVRFKVDAPPEDAPPDAPIMLSFEVLLPLPGGITTPVERISIPFSPEAWGMFQRAVETGRASSITIARPNGGRMDVPKI